MTTPRSTLVPAHSAGDLSLQLKTPTPVLTSDPTTHPYYKVDGPGQVKTAMMRSETLPSQGVGKTPLAGADVSVPAAGRMSVAPATQPVKSDASLPGKMSLIRSDHRHLFAASDDSAVLKQVQDTHTPDGREVDVKPLLRIVQDIFNRASPTVLVVLLSLPLPL